MKPNDLNDLEQIVTLLQNGTASRRDMVALLIYVRSHLFSADSPMLLDIAHCVAHPERDRELAHGHIESLLNNFIDVVKNGGTIKVDTLFPIQKVIEELNIALIKLGSTFVNEKALVLQTNHIKSLFVNILDSTEFRINHQNVSKCRFQTSQGALTFVTYFIGLEEAPVLIIPKNVGISFPVFN